MIFQAHRGSPLSAWLPSSLPPRTGSSRRLLPSARRRRGWLRAGAAPRADPGSSGGLGEGPHPPPAPSPHLGAGRRQGGGEGSPGTSMSWRILIPNCSQVFFGLLGFFVCLSFFCLLSQRNAKAFSVTSGSCWVFVRSPVPLGCNKESASWHLCFYVKTKHVEIFNSTCKEADKASPNIKVEEKSAKSKIKMVLLPVNEQNSCSVTLAIAASWVWHLPGWP